MTAFPPVVRRVGYSQATFFVRSVRDGRVARTATLSAQISSSLTRREVRDFGSSPNQSKKEAWKCRSGVTWRLDLFCDRRRALRRRREIGRRFLPATVAVAVRLKCCPRQAVFVGGTRSPPLVLGDSGRCVVRKVPAAAAVVRYHRPTLRLPIDPRPPTLRRIGPSGQRQSGRGLPELGTPFRKRCARCACQPGRNAT